MLRFNQARRTVLSNTLSELANLVVAALVVGQVVNEQPSWGLIGAGIVIWIALVLAAVLFERGTEDG